MNTKSATVFTRTVHTDFLRFMLASLATGMVAAMLLSSAVILLSVPKAISNDEVITSDSGKRVVCPARRWRNGEWGASV